MPWRPPTPCAHPGCGTLTRTGRCEAHRLPGQSPGWRQTRTRYLANHPTCAAPGCGRPAVDVDHIIARRDGGTDHPANLQALCHEDHSAKTREGEGSPR